MGHRSRSDETFAHDPENPAGGRRRSMARLRDPRKSGELLRKVRKPFLRSGKTRMADTPAAPEVPRIVVISPTRNEEATLPRTIASIEAQTLRPLRWILVDDGSTDRTPELMREAAARLPWVRVVTRPDRGYR